MKTAARLLCLLSFFIAPEIGRAQAPVTDPSPASLSPAPAEGWFHWPSLPTWPWITPPAVSNVPIPDVDPSCEFPHWYMPVELYAQGGPIFETGTGRLSNILNVGMDLEIGAKNYCYDEDRHAALLGILGLDFQLNTAQGRDRLIVHHGVTDGLDWFFRIYGRIGVGREWYYRGDDIPEAWRYVFGMEASALLGHSHAHLTTAPPEQITQVGTIVRKLDITDVALGARTGAYVGVIIPMHRKELIFSCRLDYEHEWNDLVDTDKHLDEFIFLVSAAVRY